MYDYDLLVLGAGPGGYVAALHAARQGLKTALVERDKVGGTCLQRGCVPTKALLEAAERYEMLRKASRFGLSAENVSFDYAKVSGRKDRVVLRLTKGIEALLSQAGVTCVAGTAHFADAHTVEVEGQRISARNILIATGSVPSRIPGFEGEKVWTSDELLAAKACPKALTILGGGVIGVEFASVFAAFGVQVTLIEMMPHILPAMEADIAKLLAEGLRKCGVTIYAGTKALSMAAETLDIETDGVRKTLPLDTLLVAVGRRPAVDGLNLEAAGLAADRRGLAVGPAMQTQVPHIYAVGDVTGTSTLAHAASSQAFAAVDHMLGKGGTWDGRFVPACVYTSPEIACVGMTRARAEAAGYRVRVGSFPVALNCKAMIQEEGAGLTRLVLDADSGKLLGAQLMAPRATDMIGELCLALTCGATDADIGGTIHPHPTLVEMLMEAAHDSLGHCVHQAAPKGPDRE